MRSRIGRARARAGPGAWRERSRRKNNRSSSSIVLDRACSGRGAGLLRPEYVSRYLRAQQACAPTITPSSNPMNARFIATTLALLAFTVIAHAQSTGTIVGRVFNPATNEYVRNAEL